jgi:hypothetical protein
MSLSQQVGSCRLTFQKVTSRLRKLAAKESKEARRLEKLEKATKSKARAEERAANKRYNDYWDRVKRDAWGDKLHELIKSNVRNPALNLRTWL